MKKILKEQKGFGWVRIPPGKKSSDFEGKLKYEISQDEEWFRIRTEDEMSQMKLDSEKEFKNYKDELEPSYIGGEPIDLSKKTQEKNVKIESIVKRIKKILIQEASDCPSTGGWIKIPPNKQNPGGIQELKDKGCEIHTESMCFRKCPSSQNSNNNQNEPPISNIDSSFEPWVVDRKDCFATYSLEWFSGATNLEVYTGGLTDKLTLKKDGTAIKKIFAVEHDGKWKCDGNVLHIKVKKLGQEYCWKTGFSDWKMNDCADVNVDGMTTPPETLPSWVTPEKKECIETYYENLEPATVLGINIGDKIHGYLNKGANNENKATISEDGKLKIESKASNKTYSGFWKCNSDNKFVATTCDDKQVLTWSGSAVDWVENPDESKNMGCTESTTIITTSSSSSRYDPNCSDNDKYHKGCKDGIIRRLQRCLNSVKSSAYPELKVDGKWGKNTQDKIEEKFPQYKDGVSSDDIDKICSGQETVTIANDTPTPTPTPTPLPKREKYVFRYLESREDRMKLKEQQRKIQKLKKLILEGLGEDLLAAANDYIDSKNCTEILADFKQFQTAVEGGQVQMSGADKTQLDSNIKELEGATGMIKCPFAKSAMKDNFKKMSTSEPEKLKTYMCWFSKNITFTPLSVCESSQSSQANNQGGNTNTQGGNTNTNSNTQGGNTNSNTQGGNTNTNSNTQGGGDTPSINDPEIQRIGAVPTDDASAKRFFAIAQENNCFPKWFFYERDKNQNPAVISSDSFERPFVYGNSTNNRSNYYLFFTDFTAMNLKTKEKKNWNCRPLNEYMTRPSKSDLFDKFGIDFNLGGEDLVYELNNVTSILQKFVNDKSLSKDIYRWKKYLDSKYKDNDKVTKLTIPEGQRIDIYPDPEQLNQYYVPFDTSNYPNWKGVQIYEPKNVNKLEQQGKQSGENAEKCTSILKLYLQNAILYASGIEQGPMFDLEKYRAKVLQCSRMGVYKGLVLKKGDVLDATYQGISNTPFENWGRDFEWRDMVKFFAGGDVSKKYTGKVLPSNSPYVVYLQESAKLQSKIKSSLNEMILSKKKIVLQEQIVKNRVEFLMENTTFTSRKQRRDFVVNIMKEAFYLESQGYDKKLIKEEFWDVIKGFFGKEGSESVFQSFKTRMGEWLTSHLSPKKADGWIGNCIKKTIQDIEMRDVHKITDCRFLTKEIARSVIRKLDEKMSNEELKDEGLYDIVRGGMADNVKSARFIEHIEEKVAKLICPILYSMSNKFDSNFSNMRKRVMGL